MSREIVNIDDYPEFAEFSGEEGWIITPFPEARTSRKNPAPYGPEYAYESEDAFSTLPEVKKTVLKALEKGGLVCTPMAGGFFSIKALPSSKVSSKHSKKTSSATPSKLPIRDVGGSASSWVAARTKPRYWTKFDVKFVKGSEIDRAQTIGFCASNPIKGILALRFVKERFLTKSTRSRLNIILHECAHLLDMVFNGAMGHHDRWLAITRKIGCYDCAQYYYEEATEEAYERGYDSAFRDIEIGTWGNVKGGSYMVIGQDHVEGNLALLSERRVVEFPPQLFEPYAEEFQHFLPKHKKESIEKAYRNYKEGLSTIEQLHNSAFSVLFDGTVNYDEGAPASKPARTPHKRTKAASTLKARTPSALSKITEALEGWLAAAKTLPARDLLEWDSNKSAEPLPVAFDDEAGCYIFFTKKSRRFYLFVEDLENDASSGLLEAPEKVAKAWLECFSSERAALKAFTDSFESL